MSKLVQRPVILCILDGWGERLETENNAIALGDTPNWNRFKNSAPNSTLDASESSVGLPNGQMGNSEVGHMNIGSGRVIEQDLPRINDAIKEGILVNNHKIKSFIEELRVSGGVCHLMGLLSSGGVHSHQDHLIYLAQIVSESSIPIRVHVFLDGRDTPPFSGNQYFEYFSSKTLSLNNCKVASVSGRYWAMDRDSNWDRIQSFYDMVVSGDGNTVADLDMFINESHKKNISDEFILPTCIEGYQGMNDGDGLLMANFRADRVRQLLKTLIDPNFNDFKRLKICKFATTLGMVEYSSELNSLIKPIFPVIKANRTLGQVISEAGYKQLRIAETEKYAHVTFFFNGGREEIFVGEDRYLLKSPTVSTYDLKPEMAAQEITEKLIEAIFSKNFDLIVVNYANGDMVGHTGVLPAAIKAVNFIDSCLGKIEKAILKTNYSMLITADHGNCETMYDHVVKDKHTQHTLNKVPAILLNPPEWVGGLNEGSLCDVAPTILELLNLPKPSEMTGKSFLNKSKW